MANDDLTAEQKISKAKVALMNDPDWRWLGSIMMLGTLQFVGDDHQIQTAATDGINEIYNRGFVATLTPNQVKFIVLHENFHKLFRHLFVWQDLWKECAELANVACDAIINTQYLHNKKGIEFVNGGVLMLEYADANVWNTKKVYEDLKKKSDPKDIKQGHDHHDWESAKDMGKEAEKEIEKQVDAALRQAASAGIVGGSMPRSIKELLVPSVDWKSLVSEFVKTICSGNNKATWRRPHKTYLAYDLYIPTPYDEAIGKILLAGDTSGSINDTMLGKFLGHMQTLCNEVNPDGVDLAWWDTQVRGVDVFKRDAIHSLADAVKPVGGGGTSPSCIPEWIKKEGNEYVCAVVLTDGEFFGDSVGDWGDLPVIWLVVNDRDIKTIPVGVTVHVRGEL